MLKLAFILCFAVATMSAVVDQAPGVLAGAAELDQVQGGSCFKQKYWYLWNMNCYGGDCSSGGCGCTSNYLVDDASGHTRNVASPCGTSSYCTAVTTVSSQSCSGY